MCCKDMIIGLAVGVVVGCAISGIPTVRKMMSEMKFIIEKDLVSPIKDMVNDKKKNLSCMSE